MFSLGAVDFGTKNISSAEYGAEKQHAIALPCERIDGGVRGQQTYTGQCKQRGKTDIEAEGRFETDGKGGERDNNGRELREEGTTRSRCETEGVALENVDEAGVEAEFCASEKDGISGVGVLFCMRIAQRGEKVGQDEEGGDKKTNEIKDGRGQGPRETVEVFDANGVGGPKEGNCHED